MSANEQQNDLSKKSSIHSSLLRAERVLIHSKRSPTADQDL